MHGVMDGVNKDFYPGALYEGATVQVYLNGIRLRYGVDYTQDGEKMTFAEAPLLGDSLEFEYLRENVGEGEDHQFEPGEILSGSIDGANTLFEIAEGRMFKKVTTRLFQNGLRLKLTEDYSEVGLRRVQLITAPAVGDDLKIDYIKAIENWPMIFHDPESSGTTGTSLTRLNSASLAWISRPPDVQTSTDVRVFPLIHQEGLVYCVRIKEMVAGAPPRDYPMRLQCLDPDNLSVDGDGRPNATVSWYYDLPGTASWGIYTLGYMLVYAEGKVYITGMQDDGGRFAIAIDVETHAEAWKVYDLYSIDKYDEETGLLFGFSADHKRIKAISPDDGSTVMISPVYTDITGYRGHITIAHDHVYCSARVGSYGYHHLAYDIDADLALLWDITLVEGSYTSWDIADDDAAYFINTDVDDSRIKWVKKVTPAGSILWTKVAIPDDYYGNVPEIFGQTKDHLIVCGSHARYGRILRKSDGEVVANFDELYSMVRFLFQPWAQCNDDYFLARGDYGTWRGGGVKCWGVDGALKWNWHTFDAAESDEDERIQGPPITLDKYVIYMDMTGVIHCVETA